ncbi:ABC transporter permease [Actinomyces capricornis]|uniref:Transport permease protein n=1 Tax=Actinomyces capricornis TaxID=2755559 RepID=A0ABM7U824_9ACTO|nr:ABC transporter permease [Actinomyces capricornis]BDA63544.1 hypothetical protein MANAM107_03780 [Actinomyces capricornis]
MRTYRVLVVMLARSALREPVGLFFSLIFAPMLVIILGLFFGNDPTPQFGGQGFVDAVLPACSCLVVAMTGVLLLPVTQLQLRESGALARLRATPLRQGIYVAADLSVNFLISMAGVILALAAGMLGFGATLRGNPLLVVAAVALGLVAFLALGYTLAAVLPSSRAATGIGNGLFIVLMLSSGAFIPTAELPASVQRIMGYSPFYYLVDLVRGLWGGEPWSHYGPATAVLAGMAMILGALGARLFTWST